MRVIHRSGVAAASLCALTVSFVVNPSGSAAPLPWAPPPANICGETGFDPHTREADPHAPPAPPAKIPIQFPVPRLKIVPLPGPAAVTTRIEQKALADVCVNPCPELAGGKHRTEPQPKPPVAPPPGPGFAVPIPPLTLAPQDEPIPLPLHVGPLRPLPPAPPAVHPPVEPGPVVPAVATPTVGGIEAVSQLTGPGSPNRTDKRWQVNGTDLGITWETKPGEVAVVFGDTFGVGWKPFEPPPDTADWRSNVLGFSADRNLADGMTIDRMVSDRACHAVELIPSRKIRNFETTTIPTSGFAIGNRQYMSYMAIRRWSYVPGMWYTNYGGLAYSDDGGSHWTSDEHTRWDNLFGLGQFQVGAMVPHGDYVYMFGTPNGRASTVGLARVPKEHVLNKTAYQYWRDGVWTPLAGITPAANAPSGEVGATPIISGIAAELSVRYDANTKLWQMAYLDPVRGAIVLRHAASPQGLWSDAAPLLNTADYPKAYGGFIHPWSTANDLYFTISEWDPYNVFLMRAKVGR